MHSLAKFDVKCRISLENTVSASKRCKDWKINSLANSFPFPCPSKRCKDWKMHNLAKFQVKCRLSLENIVSAC